MAVKTPRVGKLDEVPLPRVLRKLYLAKVSGVLQLTNQRDRRMIALVDGEVRSARCNRLDKRIGQFALQQELISRLDLMHALSEEAKAPLGQKLVDRGCIAQEDLDQLLKDLVEHIIIGCFEWTEGGYEFVKGKPTLPEEVEIRVSTADIIRRGIAAHVNDEMMESLIGDLDRPLAPNSNLRLLFQHVTLDDAERELIHLIDGSRSAAELSTEVHGDPGLILRRLAGLVACGLVTTVASARSEPLLGVFPEYEKLRPAVPEGKEAEARPDDGEAKLPPAKAPGRRKATVGKAPAEKKMPVKVERKTSVGDVNLMRKTIQAKYAMVVNNADYYTLLGLPFRTTQKEIYYSFTMICSIFHPDLALKPEFSDLKRELEAVFHQLEKAYDTLVDMERRNRYDRQRGFK